ncbi:hypothetical protein [Hyphomonas sp.]|uniref:hypothetical protein n=1 Tax=Hyphomonas sp. TaxID=87 RepID=UPI00391C5D38
MLAPWMLDLVMLGVAAEFAALAWILYRLRRGRWIAPLGWFLLSGALLIGALRLSLSGAAGEVIALPLAASLVTHILMLRAVWKQIP